MRKPMYLVMVIAVLITIATASSDPFIGKWVLDRQQSKYPAGECPKRMVIEIEATGQGIRYRSDAVYANGGTTHAQYTAEYVGNDSTARGDNFEGLEIGSNYGMQVESLQGHWQQHPVSAQHQHRLAVVLGGVL